MTDKKPLPPLRHFSIINQNFLDAHRNNPDYIKKIALYEESIAEMANEIDQRLAELEGKEGFEGVRQLRESMRR